MEKTKITGKTKDAGWQFGIRKSVPLKLNEVWEFLFSENGIKLWLEDADQKFSTFRQLSHIRTKWKLKDWTNEATLQMRVLSNNKDKTTIAFHIDKLLNEDQREETKMYWNNIIKIITEQIASDGSSK
ncbi:MAG: hypothetical protein J0G96_11985 [Flavobacteriia bacterium]|nr:hypothetical protein [Flavobacteriia bacterium]OJX37604.1 MAG: hypothetical protein BGO87_11045 [Flavobacteriia bacterium 40-80]